MDPLPVLESERAPRSNRRRQVFVVDEPVQAQIARLTSDVQHIQTDVADVKVSVRRVEDRLDAINGRIDDVNGNVYRLEEKLTDKIEATRSNLTEKIDGLRREIFSMKVWAMGMYFALAGSLLFVMAKGFKWL